MPGIEPYKDLGEPSELLLWWKELPHMGCSVHRSVGDYLGAWGRWTEQGLNTKKGLNIQEGYFSPGNAGSATIIPAAILQMEVRVKMTIIKAIIARIMECQQCALCCAEHLTSITPSHPHSGPERWILSYPYFTLFFSLPWNSFPQSWGFIF